MSLEFEENVPFGLPVIVGFGFDSTDKQKLDEL
jgi:hypothetical protein